MPLIDYLPYSTRETVSIYNELYVNSDITLIYKNKPILSNILKLIFKAKQLNN